MHVSCCAAVMGTVQSKALVGVGPRSTDSVSPIRESRARPTQSSSCLQTPIGFCVLLRLSPPPAPTDASNVFLFYFYLYSAYFPIKHGMNEGYAFLLMRLLSLAPRVWVCMSEENVRARFAVARPQHSMLSGKRKDIYFILKKRVEEKNKGGD
ncbi:uncharacterized protein LY79DRAFT_395877 [Colletotrichum navitas]|uniref:Uncharacterized protein n=1 Tax=Colletotrichum navitas TaxID=681940 RepID=A0AAD8PPC6_9PEZI|nr:uncharacterized protein LY79DRAFT_395877 [Colletotrichum navitas]KAK1573940.1 hypothetical protein LY79DRAFT_395877 [Colletotrichum navitas]